MILWLCIPLSTKCALTNNSYTAEKYSTHCTELNRNDSLAPYSTLVSVSTNCALATVLLLINILLNTELFSAEGERKHIEKNDPCSKLQPDN